MDPSVRWRVCVVSGVYDGSGLSGEDATFVPLSQQLMQCLESAYAIDWLRKVLQRRDVNE